MYIYFTKYCFGLFCFFGFFLLSFGGYFGSFFLGLLGFFWGGGVVGLLVFSFILFCLLPNTTSSQQKKILLIIYDVIIKKRIDKNFSLKLQFTYIQYTNKNIFSNDINFFSIFEIAINWSKKERKKRNGKNNLLPMDY